MFLDDREPDLTKKWSVRATRITPKQNVVSPPDGGLNMEGSSVMRTGFHRAVAGRRIDLPAAGDGEASLLLYL